MENKQYSTPMTVDDLETRIWVDGVNAVSKEIGVTAHTLFEFLREEKAPKIVISEKAWNDLRKEGFTKVRCPKCNQIPELKEDGSRAYMSCLCRYLHHIELYI